MKRVPWTAFSLNPTDWERINDTRALISDANQIQHLFSHERQATLWQAIPAFEELQSAWEAKLDQPQFKPYKQALQRGLDKIGKYYNKFDDKPVYILALGMYLFHMIHIQI